MSYTNGNKNVMPLIVIVILIVIGLRPAGTENGDYDYEIVEPVQGTFSSIRPLFASAPAATITACLARLFPGRCEHPLTLSIAVGILVCLRLHSLNFARQTEIPAEHAENGENAENVEDVKNSNSPRTYQEPPAFSPTSAVIRDLGEHP